MGLFTRLKEWNDGDTLYEADLEAEFDNIYDSVVAGTTSTVGMVQLEDSVTSTSVTKAATPKSVKEAYDHAGGGSVSDTAYAASWNGVTDVAPSKNAVYDKIETLGGGGTVDTFGTPVDNDFAKFTDADTIEGRSKTETLSDLNVEDGATADLTGAEIKALYEVEANAYTDTKNTKLVAIESGATKYPDTGEQAFLDADHTKLNGIETSATADQTKTDIDGLGLSHDSLSDVSANDHHAQSHNAASHSDIASSGTNIDSAVSLKHAATLIGTKTIDETDIANTKVIAYNSVSGNLEYESAGTPDAHASSHQNGGADEISVVGLSGLLADDQHVLDAEVKAAAVSDAVYAIGWNGVTDVAPSKNAVYDKIETLGGGGAPDAHKDSHDPADGSDPLDTAAPSELANVQAAGVGSSHSLARADHQHQIQHSIANDHIVTIDHATVADNDYAKFTVSGLEGRSKTEMLSDLNVVDGATKYPDTGEQAFLDADHTKLNAIETSADVTDAVNIASSIHGVAAKASMVNADEVGLMDSATSWVLKKFTFANLKAFLKTYFDTLYNLYAHPNHSGPVTSAADGATTITDKAVTLAKMNDMATASLLGRNTVATGVPEVLSKTTALSLLNVEDGADVTDATNTNAAGAVMESDYNANTFLYAVSDDTPVVKTRAETLALLSGQASASFDMNSQAITKLSNIVTTHTPGAAGTATLDLDVSRIHDITMPAGNITIAISNENNGNIFTIRILQDGTGNRTVTWFATIKWAGGSAPTLTTTANKTDTVIFRVTGTDTYDGFVVGKNV